MKPSRCTPARRQRLDEILRRIERSKHPFDAADLKRFPCLDTLVESMLAQNTNYLNTRRGYRQLRRTFRSWREVMNAPIEDVQRPIAVCGLSRMRARRLQNLLRIIHARHGTLDLQHLEKLPPREAYDYLLSFFGVGPRTAALTLLFSFDMPFFPVDAGIARMCRRLSLVRSKAREPETATAIEQMIPPGQCRKLHLFMFTHAKEMCRPRNPKCDQCVLSQVCPHGQRRLRHKPVEPELPKRIRPVILSRYASAGIPKASEPEESFTS